MWEGFWGYLTCTGIFLLLGLGQFGQWRHDQSDVRQLRFAIAVVLCLLAMVTLALGVWNHLL